MIIIITMIIIIIIIFISIYFYFENVILKLMKDYLHIPSNLATVTDVITLADWTLWHIVCVQQKICFHKFPFFFFLTTI